MPHSSKNNALIDEVSLPLDEQALEYAADSDNGDAFINEIFEEALHIPTPQTRCGKHFSDIKEAVTSLEDSLLDGDQNITAGMMRDVFYMDKETQKAFNTIMFPKLRSRDLLRQWIGQLSEKLKPIVDHQLNSIVPREAFDETPYYPQETATNCEVASYRMIFAGIVGSAPKDQDVLEAYKSILSPGRHIMDTLETPILKELSGHDIRVLPFVGADLDQIGDIITRVKQQKPATKAFFNANIGSVSVTPGIWHTNILKEVDESSVTVYDPRKRTCHEEKDMDTFHKEIPKQEFLERWACAYFSGQLVLAAPFESE